MRYLFLLFIIILSSCSSKHHNKKNPAFYHWKSKAKISSNLKEQLNNRLDKIYLHYFDVDYNPESHYNIRPKYVITEVDDWYKNQSITPVIYITNETVKHIHNVENFAHNISTLVNEISTYHFGKTLPDLQIDCDWTEQTKDKYFSLLNALKRHYNITVTIRLHQLKYPDLTGIPPVDHGVLMLYNMGDLSNMKQNSILDTDIIKSYVHQHLTYPLELDVALPLFSQTVIKNKQGRVRLLNFIPESLTDTTAFSPIKPHHFIPKKDTLYHGFFISPNFELKTEQVPEKDLIEGINIIKNTKLNINSIIYYHLDEDCINSYNISKISSTL